MSYYAINGLGEYVPVAGLGLIGLGAAPAFDGRKAWSDWVSGDASRRAGAPNGLDNAAARAIQTQLNTLGYGPVVVDGTWGTGSSAAFHAFASKVNAAVNTGCPGPAGAAGSCPTQDALLKMGQGLGSAKAGMGMMLGLGLAAAALAGALALVAKKKKKGRPRSTSDLLRVVRE